MAPKDKRKNKEEFTVTAEIIYIKMSPEESRAWVQKAITLIESYKAFLKAELVPPDS
jgi:hypothetical protein